jgi:fluoroquinolone transport system permease protein
MLGFIRKDMMLLAAGVSPFFIGAVIRFGIPFSERMLTDVTGLPYVLAPYFSLFDIFYAAITPVVFCFITAMVMLEERDDHINNYLFITQLERSGYYVSRIVLPAIASFVVTVVLLPIFRVSDLSALEVVFLSLAGTLQGIIIALLVVGFSANKLEGMAITKVSSLVMLGAIAPYFVPKPYGYLLSFMPSFWTGMVIVEKQPFFMMVSVAVAAAWIFILWKRVDGR